MKEIKIGKTYRHFKGNLYLVVAIAKDCDTQDEIVVYKALYGKGELWVRPRSNFIEKLDKEKYPNANQVYRFEEIL